MDLQAIEARLRANEAGRDGELYEHAPEDIRALIDEVTDLRMKLEAAQFQIEEVKELHRKMPLYDTPSEECAEHDQDVYSIELDSGEWYCSEHIAEWVCSECFNDGGEYVDYPCETARALGVTE